MRQDFNLQRELSKALGWCWQSQLDRGDPWVTATDLERRVRSAAAEQLDGAAYGSYGADGGYRARIKLRLGHCPSLLDACRDFLAKQVRAGSLRYYHPSGPERMTSTRLRYLPIDHPETPAERRLHTTTKEERQRQRHIVHYKEQGKGLCASGTLRPPRGRSPRYSRRTWLTEDRAGVTCKRCLKQLQTRQDTLEQVQRLQELQVGGQE